MRNFIWTGLLLFAAAGAGSAPGLAQTRHKPVAVRHIPHKQVGKASIYASSLAGHKMTSGEKLNIHSNEAASKTLPIGTKANVTDLQTGKTAQVTIEDRGPVPKGRVVDLTPHTASEIGLTKTQGIAPVVVVPTSVPAVGTKVGDITVKQASVIAPK